MSDSGRVGFTKSFVLSPIIFTGGLATNMPGGLLPIISLTQGRDFDTGALSEGSSVDTDDFFAHFDLPAGSTLVEFDYGRYPYANQAVAANSAIAEALRVSLIMICPWRNPGDATAKQAVMTNLRSQVAQHVNAGGTFTVATPSYNYTACLLNSIRDVTSGQDKQRQFLWQWDFTQPLLSQAQAQQAQNSMMSKWSSGVPLQGDPPSYSGQNPAIGNPASGQGPATVPAATSLSGASVSATQPPPAPSIGG